jgi:hypothetical protein
LDGKCFKRDFGALFALYPLHHLAVITATKPLNQPPGNVRNKGFAAGALVALIIFQRDIVTFENNDQHHPIPFFLYQSAPKVTFWGTLAIYLSILSAFTDHKNHNSIFFDFFLSFVLRI